MKNWRPKTESCGRRLRRLQMQHPRHKKKRAILPMVCGGMIFSGHKTALPSMSARKMSQIPATIMLRELLADNDRLRAALELLVKDHEAFFGKDHISGWRAIIAAKAALSNEQEEK